MHLLNLVARLNRKVAAGGERKEGLQHLVGCDHLVQTNPWTFRRWLREAQEVCRDVIRPARREPKLSPQRSPSHGGASRPIIIIAVPAVVSRLLMQRETLGVDVCMRPSY
jgi:hypothetical protein